MIYNIAFGEKLPHRLEVVATKVQSVESQVLVIFWLFLLKSTVYKKSIFW